MLFPNTVRWFNERKLENCLFSLRTGLRFVGTHTLPTTVTHSSHWLSLRVLWVRGVALCRASVYLYVFVDRMLHGTETPRLDAFLQICCLGLLGAFQEWYVVKNLMGKYQSFENVHNPGLFFSVSLAWSRLAARSQPAQIFLSLKTPWTARPAAFLLALHGQCHGDGAANVDWFVHSTSVH